MAKLTLTDFTSGYNSASITTANNDLIEAAIENTISRDGTSPNTMEAALDLNSNLINNLADGVSNQDAVTVSQLNAAALGSAVVTASVIDAESSTDGYVLTSDGAGNAAWEVTATAATYTAANMDAEASTDGYVLTSDGAGNAAWEVSTPGTVVAANINAEASTDGYVLTSDGAGNTAWEATGTGDITKIGTPANNEIAVWTGDGTLEGDANLTWDGNLLTLEAASGNTNVIMQKALAANQANLRFNNELGVEKWNIGAAGGTADDFFIGRYNNSGGWEESSIYIDSVTGDIIFGTDGNAKVTANYLFLDEKAAADTDTAGDGQIWVKNDTPNTLWFTDDAGTDIQLTEVSTANVTAAGALMDSEVDADIKTLVLPASTTISAFGSTLVDDADAAAARTTLAIDAIAPAYGEMTISGGSTATTVTDADTYYQVVADWVTGPVDDVTFTSNELIVGTTGLYFVSCSFSFTGATNDTFTFAIAKNDTVVANTAIERKTSTTDVGAASVQGIISLTAADAVQLYGKNNADTDNFTVADANFSLFRIG